MKKQILLGMWLILLSGIAEAQPHHPQHKGRGQGQGKGMKRMEEKHEEAIEFLGQYIEPERLEKLKAEKPMEYKHILRHALHQKHELEMLKSIDPERYELKEKILRLEIKSHVLSEDYRITKSKSKKKEIEKSLNGILNKLFDLKEKDKKFELKKLEKEIEKLKEVMTERKKHKAEIIEQHLERLLLEKEYMRW